MEELGYEVKLNMENILPLNIKTKQDLLELRLLVMIILKIESRIESLITLNKKL